MSNDTYSEAETKRRSEAALKRMLSTPHKPHKTAAKKRRVKRKRKGTAMGKRRNP